MEKKQLTREQTKEKALRLLDFRSHSEEELRQKLVRAGGTEIDEVLSFCREYKFIDDRSYATKLAHDLQHLKKYGKKRIKDELLSRGIDTEFTEEAIALLEDDESERLMPLVCRKLGNNFEQKNIDKVIRYFLYRGYKFNDIKNCIDELKENCNGI